jgi:hypothetical protein
VELAGQIHVVNELTLAPQQARIFEARYRLANTEFFQESNLLSGYWMVPPTL